MKKVKYFNLYGSTGQIGSKSLPIVIITSLFSGMVTSIQGAYQMTSSLIPNWYIINI